MLLRNWVLPLIVLCFPAFAAAQVRDPAKKIRVMTLGVFHFEFPNLDVQQIPDEDQIDVKEPKYQEEIGRLVLALQNFEPTKIVVEAPPSKQALYDSLYEAYRNGMHPPGRNEIEQIAFPLAKARNLSGVCCCDEQGAYPERLMFLFDDTSSRRTVFESYYFHNPDSVFKSPRARSPFKGKGIVDNLIELNSPQKIQESLGSYLIGAFKYEEIPGDFLGVDFESVRWFNRNLRIFRNVQRVTSDPSDRIIVLFGAGHMNLLNIFFEGSPEYKWISPLAFLHLALKRK